MRTGVWGKYVGPSLTDGLFHCGGGGSDWECAQFPLKILLTICDPLWENWHNVVVVGFASTSMYKNSSRNIRTQKVRAFFTYSV